MPVPDRRARQVTHLALTLEFLLLLEGQGASKHSAGIVEAVPDQVLFLFCEPGGRRAYDMLEAPPSSDFHSAQTHQLVLLLRVFPPNGLGQFSSSVCG